MALILAVDPEQRQHAALAYLAEELDGHELLSAPSCSDALAALDRRTPDLVLLPVLLPEAEESELLAQLRERAGTEVRALSIPQLKIPGVAPPPPSLHPAWLNQILHPQDETGHASEQCEPSVFADLIKGYLEPVGEAAVEAVTAVAGAARAVADKRRAYLIAAGRAAVTWARRRRERWHAPAPAIALSVPPIEIAPPVIAPPPVVAWPPVVAPPPVVAVPTVKETPTDPVPEKPKPVEFRSTGIFAIHEPEAVESEQPDREPEPVEEQGPGLVARALDRLKALKDVKRPEAFDSVGPSLVRWLPKVAAILVLLTLGVTGRTYWLKTVSAPKIGVAVLESLPSGSQVLVDGQVMGLTPLTASIPSGTHRVDFKYRGKTRTIDVVVPQNGKVSELIDWSPKTVGRLQVNSEPAGARVLIDNVSRGVTPLTLDDVPLGSHTVILDTGSGSVKRSVTIKGDEPTTLSETIYAGWLKVFAPFDITISEGSKTLRLDDRDQVMLSAGPHDLRFENRAFSYQEARHVEIQPGVTTPLSLVAPHSTLTLTTSAPAEVIIDGVNVGRTPLIDYSIQLGTRDVVIKSQAGDRRLSVPVTTRPVVLDIDFAKP
jgi:hypothetical protein